MTETRTAQRWPRLIAGAISALAPPGAAINVDLSMRADGMLPVGRFSLDDAIDGDPFVDGLDLGHGLCPEIHLVVDEHKGPVKTKAESWVLDLTTTDFPNPAAQITDILGAANHRVAVFPPAEFGPQCED